MSFNSSGGPSIACGTPTKSDDDKLLLPLSGPVWNWLYIPLIATKQRKALHLEFRVRP